MLVEVQGWMSAEEFTQLFAVAQAAPGPNVLATALFGWKIAGVAGGVVALVAFCGPAGVLAWWAGDVWDRMRDAPWRKAMQRALLPISVGFILSGGYVLATPHGLEWPSVLIAGAAAALMSLTRVNPLWTLAAGGILGGLLF